MKKRIFTIFLTLAMIGPAFGILFFSGTKEAAASVCSGTGAFEQTVESDQYDMNRTPKVMPGEDVLVTVKNCSKTNNLNYDIYIYPVDLDPYVGATTDVPKKILGYRKVSGAKLLPDKKFTNHITIQGNEPGDFIVDVVGYKVGIGSEPPSTYIGYRDNKLTIATQGIEISGESALTKGNIYPYTVKIFENSGAKFSIYIDNAATDENRKKQDISVVGDSFTYSGFSWDTAGTAAGGHYIIILLRNEANFQTKSFPVTVTDPNSTPPDDGNKGGTFSLSNLNSFNIKNLLKACPASDLEGITCMVDKVIAWLLDIGAVISFIMILYASIIYLTSYGEESKAELAKKTLIWSVIGVIVIGAAMAIMRIISNYLSIR